MRRFISVSAERVRVIMPTTTTRVPEGPGNRHLSTILHPHRSTRTKCFVDLQIFGEEDPLQLTLLLMAYVKIIT